jgi:hypothetical protein
MKMRPNHQNLKPDEKAKKIDSGVFNPPIPKGAAESDILGDP